MAKKQKNKDSFYIKRKLAKTALQLLKDESWSSLTMKKLFKKSRISQLDAYSVIKEKKDIILLINNYFDIETIKNIKKIENSSKKDKIFESMMLRFEVLNKHRIAVIKLFNQIIKKPDLIIFFSPIILKSLNIILESADTSTDGIIGNLKIEYLVITYIIVFIVWMKDETPELEKTMVALDKHLNRGDYIMNFVKKYRSHG